MTTNRMEMLQAQLKGLEADKHTLETEIAEVQQEMDAIQLAAYPHKVGDVIQSRGRTVKIVRITAGLDDVIPTVVYKLPSGGWSKREHMLIDWKKVFAKEDAAKEAAEKAAIKEAEARTAAAPEAAEDDVDMFSDEHNGWRAKVKP